MRFDRHLRPAAGDRRRGQSRPRADRRCGPRSQLPIQQYPRIESSSIIITTVYVGASADGIRGFVTTPIERAVSSITGVDYVESTSVSGLSTVTVRLKLNHPSTVALAEVGNRLDQIRSELPSEIEFARRRGAARGPPLRDLLRQRDVLDA